MQRYTMMMIGCLCAVLFLSSTQLSHASEAELAQLKARMTARYQDLRAAMNTSKIGETSEGYIAAVTDEARGAYAALIAAENADRAKLYAILAAKHGVSVDLIAKRAAQRNFESAQPGDLLRKADGTWVRKR